MGLKLDAIRIVSQCYLSVSFANLHYNSVLIYIAPFLYALKRMISISKSYEERIHIIFSPTKSKLLCYIYNYNYVNPNTLDLIYLNKQSIQYNS